MASRRGVFDFDSLTPNLKRLLPVIDAGVDLAFDAAQPMTESYARDNAPWTDRTSNARNGLFATHDKVPMVVHKLVVYHTMPYGLWLEIRWSGRYAIIGPTLFHMAPHLAVMTAESVRRAVQILGGL